MADITHTEGISEQTPVIASDETPTNQQQPPPQPTPPPQSKEIEELRQKLERTEQVARKYQSEVDRMRNAFAPEQQAPSSPADIAAQNAYTALKSKGFKEQDAQDMAFALGSSVNAALQPILGQLNASQAHSQLPNVIQQTANSDPIVAELLQNPAAYREMEDIVRYNASQGVAPNAQMVQNAAYMVFGRLNALQRTLQQPQQPAPAPLQFAGQTFQGASGFHIRPQVNPQANMNDGQRQLDAELKARMGLK